MARGSIQQIYSALLPYDVIWEIIDEIWHSPLSTHERICFMASSLVVNRTWMNVFTRIAYKDVHIPSPAYLQHYLRILHQGFSFYDESFRDLPSELGRSITIDPQKETGKILSDLLYRVKITGTLPYLHTLSIVYTGFSPDEIFDCYQFIDFPPRVENLELHFRTGDSQYHRNIAPSILSDHSFQVYPPWYIPFLRRLSIVGGDERLIRDYLLACPRLTILETDFDLRDFSFPSNSSKTKPEHRLIQRETNLCI